MGRFISGRIRIHWENLQTSFWFILGGPKDLRKPGLPRFRAEGSGRVALGTPDARDLALACQFFESLFLVVGARQRRHESNEIVDVPFRERKRLDVCVQERIT